MGDLPNLRVAQAGLTSLGPLLEDAQHPGLGGLPVDAPAPLRMAGDRETPVQIVAQGPVRTAAGASALQIAKLDFHPAQGLPNIALQLLRNLRCRDRVDVWMPQ